MSPAESSSTGRSFQYQLLCRRDLQLQDICDEVSFELVGVLNLFKIAGWQSISQIVGMSNLLPIDVDPIKPILLHEINQIIRKLLSISLRRSYVTKYGLRVRSIIAERPASKRDIDLKVRESRLEGAYISRLREQRSRSEAIHRNDLKA